MSGTIKRTHKVELNNGQMKEIYDVSTGENTNYKSFIQEAAYGQWFSTTVNVTGTQNLPTFVGITGDAPRSIILKNLSSDNYVNWGIDSSGFVKIGSIDAGDDNIVSAVTGNTYQLSVDTGVTPVLVIAYGD